MRPTKLQVSLNQALSKCKRICDLESIVNRTLVQDFNGVNSSTALSQLGKLSKLSRQQPSKPVVDKLLKVAELNKAQLQPFALANICYGIALGKLTPHIPQFVLERLASDGFAAKCSGQDISMSLWSLATTTTTTTRDDDNVSTDMAIANACRAIVLASKQSDDTKRLSSYSFQTLANIVWSLATLQQQHQDEVFDLIAKELCARDWHKIKSQDVANIAWSYASLGFANPVLFEKISNVALQMFHGFTQQEMVNLVWSCATLEEMWPAALQQKFSPLYKQVETMLVSGEKVYTSRHFAQMSFSLAKLRRVSNVPLVASKHVNVDNARDVLDVLWSIAMVCPLTRQRPEAIEFADRIALPTYVKVQSSPRQLCLMLWCFASLGVLNKPNVKRVFMQRPTAAACPFDLSHLDLQQLAMVRLAWQQEFLEERSALLDWVCTSSSSPKRVHIPPSGAIHTSETHQRITNWLRTDYPLLPNLIDEYVLPEGDGVMVVDAYLPALNMVLEFDGPHHFDSQTGDIALGNKRFKRRMIKKAGYALLSINLKDYQARSMEERVKMFDPLLNTLT